VGKLHFSPCPKPEHSLVHTVPKRVRCLPYPVPDCGGDAAVADGVLPEELPFRHLRWIKSKGDKIIIMIMTIG
jgi:hypothetical protein